MRSGCLFAVFFFSLFICCQSVSGAEVSCVRSGVVDGQTVISFLQDSSHGARCVYLTHWLGQSTLVSCRKYTDQVLVDIYHTQCSGNDTMKISTGFDLSLVFASDTTCALTPSEEPHLETGGDERGRKRQKRSWLLPGTLWCGTGSKARGYDQLGMFEHADVCCREHDHCKHSIPALSLNYGVFNHNLFTVSHCECDQRFRQCLMRTNDSISRMVGYAFFNVLQVPCFELKRVKRCTEMYWWGMCKKAQEAPYAVFKKPLSFNASERSSEYGDTVNQTYTSTKQQNLTKVKRTKLGRKPVKAKPRCGLGNASRNDSVHHKRKTVKECKRRYKLRKSTTTTPSPAVSTTLTSKAGSWPKRTRTHTNETVIKDKSKLIPMTPIPIYSTSELSQQPSPVTPAVTLVTTPHEKLQANPRTVSNFTKHQKMGPNCCDPSMLARGDTFQPECRSCLKKGWRKALPAAAKIPNHFPKGHKKRRNKPLPRIAEATTQRALVTTGLLVTTAIPITAETKKPLASSEYETPHKRIDHHHQKKSKSNQRLSTNSSIQKQRHLKNNSQKSELPNLIDKQFRCRSLKHLDDCEFKIPPREKKYNLQNSEAKTVYHCNCTSCLALEITKFKKPSFLSSFLSDFVSPQCFTLTTQNIYRCGERCSGSYVRSSDLYQVCNTMKEQNTQETTPVSYKRRMPISLYKRCLRVLKRTSVVAKLNI